MEKIYRPGDYCASELLDVNESCTRLMEKVAVVNIPKFQMAARKLSPKEEEVLNFFGIPLDPVHRKTLCNHVSWNKMDCPQELILSYSHDPYKRTIDPVLSTIPEDAKHLRAIQLLQKRVRTSCGLRDNKDSFLNRLKYRSEKRIKDITGGPEDLIPNESIVMQIRIHVPFRYAKGHKCQWLPKFSHEIEVLGTNTIGEFRKKILCPSDVGISSDISNVPSITELDPFDPKCAKVVYKSSVICIGNNLFVDDDEPDKLDYAATILDWAKSRRTLAGPFTKKSMHDTQFKDLKLRLGYPYVYQHLGDCEHIFTITDIRLLHNTDALSSTKYPRHTAASSRVARYCNICGGIVARYIITNCDRLIGDPSYLCDACFKSYLYIDNKKIGEFKAYMYYDTSCMM